MSRFNSNTDWFSAAGYGIMVNYLADDAGLGDGYDPIQWKNEVESFDTKRYVDDIIKTNARYLIMTLGQNTGFFCAPNTLLENDLGRINSPDSNFPKETHKRTTDRDLPMEIIDELNARNADVKMLLYLPSHPSGNDKKALETYGWTANKGRYGMPYPESSEAIIRWFEVAGWWSKHYGNKIVGWWIDGMYEEELYDLDLFSKYLKSGNQDSIVCFNRGINDITVAEADDYLAGEQNDDINRTCHTRWTNERQSHILTYLGNTWGSGDVPVYSKEQVLAKIKEVMKNGACITYDLPLSRTGIIPKAFLDTMTYVGDNLKN